MIFFNFIKNICGGFLTHCIVKPTKTVFVIPVIAKLNDWFMCKVLLYEVSIITLFKVLSMAVILNNDHPFILSALVSAVNVILILLTFLKATVVSFVNGGVINDKLSWKYISVSLGGLLLLLFVTVSFPQLAKKLIIIKIDNNIKIAVANLLFIPVGLIPTIFLISYKDKMFKCCLIFLKGLMTYVILGFIPGLFFTLLIPMLYSSTDFGFNASLRFMGNISIITSVNFLNQLILSPWSSVTLSVIELICFCVVLFFINFNRASQLTTGCYDSNGRNTCHYIEALKLFYIEIWNHNTAKIYNTFSFVKYYFPLMLKTA